MRLSIKSIYGLLALFELTLHFGKGGVRIGEIARAQKIPLRFLEQILLTLKKKGILESTRGVKGGYSLAKPPREITLLEVFQTLEGPLVFSKIKKNLDIYQTLRLLKENIETNFKEKTLEDLISLKQQSSDILNYSI
ncbi:MAG: Rrf2 family transcriptional regulator [Candidatus Margulisiibacteriota bacterium]